MIGKVLGNRYEIVEKIGSGGMSFVYKARCSLLNRYVAVKILRPEFISDENFVRKFRQESQAAASLSHQNIVSIYDVGVDDDIHYIVMEYIEGRTLKQIIREKGRMDPLQAAEIAQQICKALVHAHKNHIVHRDIKPHNILVTKDGTAKVTDFGIARAVTSSTVTNSGSVIGSVHYFSPEQARGGYIDEKSDLYSLGIVLYEMVTGRVPFEGESPISIALKHIQESVTPPTDIIDGIPAGLEQIIMKAIQKDPGSRYETAGQMLDDLKVFTNNNDIVFDMPKPEEEGSPTIVMPAVGNGSEERNMRNGKKAGNTKKKPKNKKFYIVAALIVIALIAVGYGGSLLIKEMLFVDVVEVPDIRGMTEEEAEEELNKVGLKMEIRERKNNPDFEAGTIISQHPKEGTENKVSNPVLVVLSLGPEKTEVPYLINRSSSEAQAELQEAGLVEGEIKTRFSETVPVGVVMDQSPQPGIRVDEGTPVDLVISSGPEMEPVIVPAVVGLDLQTAKTRIQNAGMILGDTYPQESDIVPEGYIIRQSVPPNSVVEEGASIGLWVSTGKKVVEQPPTEGTKVLTINLPEGKNDVKVTVKKYQDGVEEIEYQMRHDADEGPLKIAVTGKGKARIVVLFDDVEQWDEMVDFGKED
jgi:serine/threonine protein kinase